MGKTMTRNLNIIKVYSIYDNEINVLMQMKTKHLPDDCLQNIVQNGLL